MLSNDALTIWSEQGTSMHRKFVRFLEKYKINLGSDQSYEVRFKKAVVEFRQNIFRYLLDGEGIWY